MPIRCPALTDSVASPDEQHVSQHTGDQGQGADHQRKPMAVLRERHPANVHPKQARVTAAEVRQLEIEIDRANAELAPLRSFVLPGGTRLNTELHACRTICRRAERLAVTLARDEPVPPETIQYLNRLSDAFFVWSRWVNHALGVPEVLWEPNQSASSAS